MSCWFVSALALIIGAVFGNSRPYPYPPDFDAKHYPFPFENGISPCYDKTNPPPILSFHVHCVFDGKNRTASKFALGLRSSFMDYIGKIDPTFAKECTFSHMNPAGFMKKMCTFPFDQTMDDFPFDTDDLIWSSTNFAFFVPKDYLLVSEMWWRQHNDAGLASFAFHVNTGCEDNSHTIWTTVNEGYPWKTNASGLLCCRSGPAGCSCDMAQFTVPDGKCITYTEEDDAVELRRCDMVRDIGMTLWKETTYNDTFVQIESAGLQQLNTYMCLGQDSGSGAICERGTKITMVPCWNRDNRLNVFEYKDEKIKATQCKSKDLCVSQQGNGLVLESCADATKITKNM